MRLDIMSFPKIRGKLGPIEEKGVAALLKYQIKDTLLGRYKARTAPECSMAFINQCH